MVYFTTFSLYEVTQRRGYDDGMNNQNLCTNIREMIKILFWSHSKRTEGQTQKPLLKIAGSSTDIGIRHHPQKGLQHYRYRNDCVYSTIVLLKVAVKHFIFGTS